MKLLPYIRLASYVVVALAFFLLGRQMQVIPLNLVGGDYAYAHDQQRTIQDENQKVPLRKGFEHTTKSGNEVIAIAIRVAEKSGANLASYTSPQISLKEDQGRLVWFVTFSRKEPMPGGFFSITIDDQSGDTKIYPGM